MDSQEAALHLTDYVRGTLDAYARARVAGAVAADPELQALEAWLRRVQRLLAIAGGAILGHPSGDQLVAFALTPDDADPETAAHAVSCPSCRELVAQTRGVRGDLASRDSLWQRLARAFSWRHHAAPFALGAAIMLGAMLLFPHWLAAPVVGPDAAPDGATRTLYVAATVRGAGATSPTSSPTPTVSLAGGSSVVLLLEADPFVIAGAGAGDAADAGAVGSIPVALELRREDAVVFAWQGPATDIWNADLGVLSLLVPAGALAPGTHELLLEVAGQTAMQRSVLVLE